MERLLENKDHLGLSPWIKELSRLVKERRDFLENAKGNFLRFRTVVESMPDIEPGSIKLDAKAVKIGTENDASKEVVNDIRTKLELLCPWRKGPFDFFGITIDSEWQSWMKWDRLTPHIGNLLNKKILDIGSSNGYYMFRMAEQKPRMILGVEPQSSFYFQYLAVQKYLKQPNVYCLPVPHDRLPKMDGYFDMVFCMGVLYHRKSPIEMLKDICDSLRPGGQIVLENLVLESKRNVCLFPRDRYAKMRNVFFIPDLAAMESWLMRAGFTDIRCVDVTKTGHKEQRKTPWIHTETLADFLDPRDASKTIEGYPAPVRGVFIAKAAK